MDDGEMRLVAEVQWRLSDFYDVLVFGLRDLS